MIDWELRGDVGLAVINRPERRNALDTQHCHELRGRLVEAGDLRAVVITGAGTAFCAGADLGSRFGESRAREDEDFHAVLQRLLEAIEEHPAPVIAAVNGPALGAGTQLAVACDLRVASREAVFGIPAARLGVMIGSESVERLVQVVGLAHAAELLLTGRQMSAGDALRIGLVHHLADDARGSALEWADEIARLAPLSVRGHKRALNLVAAAGRLDPAAKSEIDALIRRALESGDLVEGLRAFSEKRTPQFRGE